MSPLISRVGFNKGFGRRKQIVSAGGGGSDVTPSNTTWWDNVTSLPPVVTNTVTITGINVQIELNLVFLGTQQGNLKCFINGQEDFSILLSEINNQQTFFVSNGDTVYFELISDVPAGYGFEVYNISDGSGVLLDTFVLFPDV